MPLLRMRNTKPGTDDIVWIAQTDTRSKHVYNIKTKTWVKGEERYRGNGHIGRFETSDKLQRHIERYIEKKEIEGFIICP